MHLTSTNISFIVQQLVAGSVLGAWNQARKENVYFFLYFTPGLLRGINRGLRTLRRCSVRSFLPVIPIPKRSSSSMYCTISERISRRILNPSLLCSCCL